MRVAVAIRKGEQLAEVSEFGDALKEYQKALEANRTDPWRISVSPKPLPAEQLSGAGTNSAKR